MNTLVIVLIAAVVLFGAYMVYGLSLIHIYSADTTFADNLLRLLQGSTVQAIVDTDIIYPEINVRFTKGAKPQICGIGHRGRILL